MIHDDHNLRFFSTYPPPDHWQDFLWRLLCQLLLAAIPRPDALIAMVVCWHAGFQAFPPDERSFHIHSGCLVSRQNRAVECSYRKRFVTSRNIHHRTTYITNHWAGQPQHIFNDVEPDEIKRWHERESTDFHNQTEFCSLNRNKGATNKARKAWVKTPEAAPKAPMMLAMPPSKSSSLASRPMAFGTSRVDDGTSWDPWTCGKNWQDFWEVLAFSC